MSKTKKRGGLRSPPGGRPKKSPNEKYKRVPLMLPPDLIEWLSKNTDNRNNWIVMAIRGRITKTLNNKE